MFIPGNFHRRRFLKFMGTTLAILPVSPLLTEFRKKKDRIMTVNGMISPRQAGITLSHEHILVDFIGADQVSPDRYDREKVFQKVLPYLEEIKKLGCRTFVACTPAYLGRDVTLLKSLANAAGLQIITNTGYYGAREGAYLPENVAAETPEQIALHWIREYKQGIDGTETRPGFIKIGVNIHPLPGYDQKIVKAAALAHRETGLTIAAHTGDAAAAFEELAIIQDTGLHPSAFIWVHAQNKGAKDHLKAARMGAWVEIDGVSRENYKGCARQVKTLHDAGLLDNVLVSCDAGWYHVGEPSGGHYRSHATVFTHLVPALKKLGLKEYEIEHLLVRNPAEAFTIRVRKVRK